MAITALRQRTVELIEPDGQLVQDDTPMRYESLEAAIDDLKTEALKTEESRLRAALIIRDIERGELFKQIPGCDSMKAFYPLLWARLENISWKSTSSFKRWLALVKLYLEQLDLNREKAVLSASSLFILARLADLDRKTGLLRDEASKEGKLGASEFDTMARLVVFMKTGFTREQMVSGMDVAATRKVLDDAGLGYAAGTFQDLMGYEIQLPVKGWSTADTQAIVDHLTGKETDEDEDDEEQVEVHRVWKGYETFEGGVFVEAIEFRRGEVLLDTIEVAKQFSTAEFEVLRGKDAKQIAGQGGEQAGE